MRLGEGLKSEGAKEKQGVAIHRRDHFSGLYQIQFLVGSSARCGLFLMLAMKSHCWLWPSTKRVGATSMSGTPQGVVTVNVFPGLDEPCHCVTSIVSFCANG